MSFVLDMPKDSNSSANSSNIDFTKGPIKSLNFSNLCSERNLMISEELILKGSTLKSVADKYLISSERARQIKVDCLFYIKRYNYNLKNNKV